MDKLHTAFHKKHLCYDKPKKVKGGIAGEINTEHRFPDQGFKGNQMSFVVVHYAEHVMYTVRLLAGCSW